MGTPVAASQLVTDQPVCRGRVRNAQQRFGQTHQRHAFLTGQRKLLHQMIDAAGTGTLIAHRLHQLSRQGLDLRYVRLHGAPRAHQPGHQLAFIYTEICRDGLPRWRK